MGYFIEITRDGQHYRGILHQGNPVLVQTDLKNLAIGPDVEVDLGLPVRLQQIVDASGDPQHPAHTLITGERSQLALGHHLYAQLFETKQPATFKKGQDPHVDLRIRTDDAYIARLPWNLLAHEGTFLATMHWSVALCKDLPKASTNLPASPRLLVVLPEPTGWPPTRARTHLEALEQCFAPFDRHLTLGSNIARATTWEEFRQQLPNFKPHIIYYYGHGSGDRHHARLIFATGARNKAIEKPIAEFAQMLHQSDEPPLLAYLNFCSGDAGGFLGAGSALSAFIPAVVTNRTAASVDAAQAQGLAFWERLLIDAQPPHRVLAELCGKLADHNLSLSDARWMTPVLHSHYTEWHATPPQRIDPLEHDPHWHLKLDRVSQFGTVAFQTRQMLREKRPCTLAYVWYGQRGQGVELFHTRLRFELQQDLGSNTHFHEITPAWPMDFADPARSFEDMLSAAFDVKALRDIPGCLRARTRGATGSQTLVYVRHEPVRSQKTMTPRLLKTYLEWWAREVVPLLGSHSHAYALLTVSFEVNNPARFRDAILGQERLDRLTLNSMIFRLLDEMERLGMKDLFEFLQTHNIRLPPLQQDQILQDILERTKGNYDQTVSSLKRLVTRALDEFGEEEAPSQDEPEEYDY